MTKKELLNKIAKERKSSLSKCKGYYGLFIEEESDGAWKTHQTLDELEHYLYQLDLTDWEDVGFFVGYLRALEWMSEQLAKAK